MVDKEMTLRELIDEAQNQLETYKNPDTSEVVRRLHEILVAGGLGGIIHDKLEGLGEYNGQFIISTSYSVRCCNQTAEYKFPSYILDSKDPITDIKIWALEEKFKKAKASVEWHKKEAEAEQAKVNELAKKISLLRKEKPL